MLAQRNIDEYVSRSGPMARALFEIRIQVESAVFQVELHLIRDRERQGIPK